MRAGQSEVIPVITLDGPSGSGKGTVAELLARAFGWHLLDSGALYRIVALTAVERGVALNDPAALAAMTQALAIHFELGPGEVRIRVDEHDVTGAIRSDTVSQNASLVAQHDAVRAALLDVQHSLRQPPGLIADGRDMGSVVFTDAPLKIYLDATAEERARRRHKQLKDKGLGGSLRGLLKSIQERDQRDMNRSVSPLIQAPDAILIDSTHLSIDEVVDEVIKHAQLRNLPAC